MKHIKKATIKELCAKALRSDRLRCHLNFHDSLDEDIQRLLIAMQPGTYIHPHKHPEDYKKEMLILLQGSCLCITFTTDGQVIDSVKLTPEDCPIAEFPDQVYHTLICTSKDTVVMEVKRGPYEPLPPNCFAPWAPKEGDIKSEAYIKSLSKLVQGI